MDTCISCGAEVHDEDYPSAEGCEATSLGVPDGATTCAECMDQLYRDCGWGWDW